MSIAPATCAHVLAQSPLPAAAVPPPRAVGWAELAPQRAFLVAWARRRLFDPALADDLVHDVFEAVVSGRAVFGGRSALRSWLIAILKHKLVDLLRQRAGHDSLDAMSDETGEGCTLACLQPQPDEVAAQRQGLAQVLARVQALPETLRRAVEMRLLQDESSAEVCRALAISESNLFVRLHRARRLLAA